MLNLSEMVSCLLYGILLILSQNHVRGSVLDQNLFAPLMPYGQLSQYDRIELALGKLEHVPDLVKNWPQDDSLLGQVSGLALDNDGNLLVFHRASHTWDASTFNMRNVYQDIGGRPIREATVLVYNKTGDLIDFWGENFFFIPHGITVDREGNIWLTDVAMHQVFKFKPGEIHKPAMVLGEKFVPGSDSEHFCKPSAVAVMSNGDFFVADGYCNTRIIKFAPDGTRILQWGRASGHSPYSFSVPHALTLAEERGLVCVADREHGRVLCFRADNGTYVTSFASWLLGGRLFSVAYAPVRGGRLYVVNGPGTGVPVRGYTIDFTSGRLIGTFAPEPSFSNPHDVVTSPDGANVYVAELNPHRVYRFMDSDLVNETVVKRERNVSAIPVKPEVTLAWGTQEWWPVGAGWRGAAGGAVGAAGAALVLMAVVAVCRARRRGKDTYEREPLFTE